MKIKLTYSPEDIHEGKNVLGFLWIIILRFAINDVSEEELTAKEGLLLWCKKTLAPYKNIQMNNFTNSWQDGLAFNGLIHRFHPDWLDYDSLKKDNAIANLNQAFALAEERLGIPKLMDAEDLVVYADEKSIMTYVSFYWKAFAASSKSTQAGRRIAKALSRKQGFDAVRDAYTKRASELSAWVKERTDAFSKQDFSTDYAETLDHLQKFNSYRVDAKPPKASEKTQLEILFHNFQTQLANAGVKPFVAPEGLAPQDLKSLWELLDQTESAYEKALRAALLRNKNLDALVKRFRQRESFLTSWAAEKTSALEDGNLGDSLYAVQGLIKKHEALVDEIQANDTRFESIDNIAKQIAALDASHPVLADLPAVLAKKDSVRAAADSKNTQLQAQLAVMQQRENTFYELAKRAERLNLWTEDAVDTLTNPILAESTADVEKLRADLATFKTEFDGKNGELATFISENQALDITNPHSRYSTEQLSASFQKVQEEYNTRTSALDQEHSQQSKLDVLRKAFAAKADELAAFSSKIAENLKTIEGTQEEQLVKLEAARVEKEGSASLLDAAQAAHQDTTAAGISENPYTKYTFEELREEWSLLDQSIVDKRSALEKEILLRQNSDVSPQQLQEFRDSFNHFDKTKNGTLSRHEFAACLQTLGEELTESIWTTVASTDNAVDFDEYVRFMSARVRDSESKAQVADSFKILSKDKDYITEADLRSVLEPAQVEYLVANLPPKGDGYDYQAFLDTLYK